MSTNVTAPYVNTVKLRMEKYELNQKLAAGKLKKNNQVAGKKKKKKKKKKANSPIKTKTTTSASAHSLATADPISSTVLTNQASATIPNVSKNTTIETKVTLPLPDKLATVSLCSLDKDHPCALLFAEIMARNAKSENLGSNVNPIDVDQ